MKVENGCAIVSGIACVFGITVAELNQWLTAFSLLISIAAGVLTLYLTWRHRKRPR